MTIKDEIIEVIERRKIQERERDLNNVVNSIDNMILIYSILKTDKSLVKSQQYESLIIELQELKIIFQIELQCYLKNKKEKK